MPVTSFQRIPHIFTTKCCSNKFKFLICMLLSTCFLVCCYNDKSITSLGVPKFVHRAEPHECNSLDIRNECASFKLLENCTAVKGYLIIVLLPKDKIDNNETCKYDAIRFPLLREVTDYMIFFHVKGLKTLRHMFPSLTVIRGRRLVLNYAIGITEMPDLEAVEFRSLVAIQRGHVFIGSSPKLCQLEKINWDRLTLSKGNNHVYPASENTCKQKAICNGCEPPYCWSNFMCQKFENDNVLNITAGIKDCHEECLGGCWNATNAGCNVCKGLTDHGVCVKQCPSDKFLHEHSQRCYTKDECINEMNLLIHEGSCVLRCPSGFKAIQNHICERCNEKDDGCLHFCEPEPYSEDFIAIYSLTDADNIAGCEVVNSTLMIIIKNKINENDLVRTLGSIREIRGYLKVYRSPYLTSLNFLSNLKKIAGNPTESGYYSLIIYDNKSLKELWKPNLKLERGGMYIHLNNKLCNHNLLEFSADVEHDHSLDTIQTSDQETLCGPMKLLLDVQVLSHRKLLFSWLKEQTYERIEIMYRSVLKSEQFNDETELDTPICERITWSRELVFQENLNDNGTHYSYAVDELNQNSKYACLIKTFGESYKQTARSDLIFMTTKADIPPPPKIEIIKKTNLSLTIELNSNNNYSTDFMIDHYLLEVYEKPDNVNYLDNRDFCLNPAQTIRNILTEIYSNSNYNEDYDDCCARLQEKMDDERFRADIIAELSRSLDRKKYNDDDSLDLDIQKSMRNLRLPSNESKFEIEYLKPFHLYVMMVKACNVIGCSSFSMSSDRTNYTLHADMVGELDGCYSSNHTEYRVFFNEPKNPNGAIVSYVIHLREYIPDAEHYHSHISCITRRQHENSNNVYVRHINSTFNEVAVRAHSLAGAAITPWQKISPCDATSIAANTKLAGFNKKNAMPTSDRNRGGIKWFFISTFIICVTVGFWAFFFKYQLWRRISAIYRRLQNSPSHLPNVFLHDPDSLPEDRRILVDNYETVRFMNRHSEDEDNDTSNISSLSDF